MARVVVGTDSFAGEDRAEALDALPSLDVPSTEALAATGTDTANVLPSCLPEGERFRDRKCKVVQGRRGRAEVCSGGEQGAKTQGKPDVSAPFKLARPAGLEPAACGLGNRRSIQLSYGRL